MKYKERIKFLLKVKIKVYNENPELQKLIDASMVEVCTKEGVFSKQVIYIFLFFAVIVIIMSYSIKKAVGINILCVRETAHENSRVYLRKK